MLTKPITFIAKCMFLLISIITLSNCATTLKPTTEPQGNLVNQADTIFLMVDQTPDEAYQGMASHLSKKGFGFENTDQTLLILRTDYREVRGTDAQYYINVKIESEPTTIIISGRAKNENIVHFDIENRGISGSLTKSSWDTMHRVALDYPHSKVKYARN